MGAHEVHAHCLTVFFKMTTHLQHLALPFIEVIATRALTAEPFFFRVTNPRPKINASQLSPLMAE
jgi:hypothetical protein